jgi:DNA polymerase I-like protein with 3'-5' exonuclease and polymerase domains
MGNHADDDAYAVGYGKPPVHSRFQKGKSGNPAGRKKGARSLNQEVMAALNEKVAVNQNGRRRTMTKLQAALKQAFNKAAQGDPKATKLMLDLARQSDQDEALKAVLDAADKPASVVIFELPDNGR